MVGCIPEVITLVLTPILTYIHMVYVRAPYKSKAMALTLVVVGRTPQFEEKKGSFEQP